MLQATVRTQVMEFHKAMGQPILAKWRAPRRQPRKGDRREKITTERPPFGATVHGIPSHAGVVAHDAVRTRVAGGRFAGAPHGDSSQHVEQSSCYWVWKDS